jgi:hypothetical protein
MAHSSLITRCLRSIVALAALSGTAAFTPVAVAAVPTNPGTGGPVTPAPGPPNQPPAAVGKLELPRRADASRDAWDPRRDNYDVRYARPSSWSVYLDACGSSGGTDARGIGQALRVFKWRLQPLDGQRGGVRYVSSSSCGVSRSLPELGRWRAQVTVRTAAGRMALSSARDFRLRDLVILALGDSYVSGEGNPEQPAAWGTDIVGRPKVVRRARWSDTQCHRSRASWALKAARSLENSTTSVTFLSYACSGATVENIYTPGYTGAEPLRSDGPLPAQVVAAREALGDPVLPDARPVQTLLMSAGINNLDFSGILIKCAESVVDGHGIHVDPLVDAPCDAEHNGESITNGLADLPDAYDRLAVALAANLRIGTVRVVEYPSRFLTDGADRPHGCGVLSGISPREARWLLARGENLNGALWSASRRNGWDYVGGIRDAFRHHGYCAHGRQTWFRSFSGSLKLQGDKEGTSHPLWAGHDAVGRIVAPTLPRTDVTPPPLARVAFHFTRVRVTDLKHGTAGIREVPAQWPVKVGYGVLWNGARTVPGAPRASIKIGDWVDVPGSQRRFVVTTPGNTIGISGYVELPALHVSDEHALHGFDSTGTRWLKFFVQHRRDDHWRAGAHRIVVHGNHCSLEVEYRVEVLPAGPANGLTRSPSRIDPVAASR